MLKEIAYKGENEFSNITNEWKPQFIRSVDNKNKKKRQGGL